MTAMCRPRQSAAAPASLWTSSLRPVMYAPRTTMTTFSPKICTPITRNMPWMRATRTASRTTMPLQTAAEIRPQTQRQRRQPQALLPGHQAKSTGDRRAGGGRLSFRSESTNHPNLK